MNTSDIQNNVVLALQKIFGAPSNNDDRGKRESFDNSKDRDPFKTGMNRFSTTQSGEDIFTYLSHFTTTVSLVLSEADKKRALIERIDMKDRLKLAQLQIDELSFDSLKAHVGKLLSTPELGRTFENFFQSMKMTGTITDHFLEATEKWNGYAAWKASTQKPEPEESHFLDKFEESLPDYIRPAIIKARIEGAITNIQTLGTYIETYKQMWQDNTSNIAHQKILYAKLHTLQTQNDSLQEAIKLVFSEQKEARHMAEASKQLNQIVSDNSTKLTEKVNRQSVEMHERLQSLSQKTEGVQDTISSERYAIQRQILELQNQNRVSNLNNFSGPFVHRDRQKEDRSSFRGRDRREQSPTGYPKNNYSSGESRSPSPNPIDNKCYACGDEHWQVRCPHLSRVEKENELFKILARKIKTGRSRSDEENLLRTEYGVQRNVKSMCDLQANNRKFPPQGQGPYCKWCHSRGHATLVCASFCCLCETTGHGWRECTDANNKAMIQQRTQAFKTSLLKADKISYKA